MLFFSLGLILTKFLGKINFYGLFANYSFTLVLTFFGRCFEFLSGVFLSRIITQNKMVFLKKISSTYCGSIGVLLIIITLSLVGGLATYEGIFLHNIILPIFICVLIYGLVHEQSFISKILSLSIAQLLGKSSYAFFLIHVGIFHTLFYQYIISNLVLELLYATTLSILLFKVIEEPLSAGLKKH